MSEIIWANGDNDHLPACDGYHDASRIDAWGVEVWFALPCNCADVQVGIVNGTKRFSVRTTGSDIDDLPF